MLSSLVVAIDIYLDRTTASFCENVSLFVYRGNQTILGWLVRGEEVYPRILFLLQSQHV